MEVVKDPSEECGWRRVTYEGGGKVIQGEGADGVVAPAGESTDMDVDVGVCDSTSA